MRYILSILLSILYFSTSIAAPKQAKVVPNVIELSQNNHISIRGPIFPENASQIVEKIFSEEDDNLIIYIDSPGGDVDAGLRIIEAMRGSGKHFTCVANFAASMAFSIFQQCQDRYVLGSSVLMQHFGSVGIKGQANKINTLLVLVNRTFLHLNQLDSSRIGIDIRSFQEKIRDDWWIFGKENVHNNTADGTTMIRCESDLSRRRDIEEVSMPLFNVNVHVEYSGCPFVSDPVLVEVKPIKMDQPQKVNTDDIVKMFYRTNFPSIIKTINIKKWSEN